MKFPRFPRKDKSKTLSSVICPYRRNDSTKLKNVSQKRNTFTGYCNFHPLGGKNSMMQCQNRAHPMLIKQNFDDLLQ